MVRLQVVPDDRQERRHDRRRQRYLEAAGRIIDRAGVAGITMAAIAEELDCAVGTIYTYFPSKAALLEALSGQAIETLRASYQTARQGWDAQLEGQGSEAELLALVHLQAYAGFLAAAAVVFADEFSLQGSLLHTPGSLPVVLAWLEDPRSLVEAAVGLGVLRDGDSLERALRWVTAIDAMLALDGLSSMDRHLFRATHHARSLTSDLLVGWGAEREQVEVAAAEVDRLAAAGPLAPPPDR